MLEEAIPTRPANNLIERREGFGSVAVPRNLICPLEDSLLFITGGDRSAKDELEGYYDGNYRYHNTVEE